MVKGCIMVRRGANHYCILCRRTPMVDSRPNSGWLEMILRSMASLWLLVAGLLLTGCSEAPDTVTAASPPRIIDMVEDLAILKSDFNAAVDQVRLVFIVGPT